MTIPDDIATAARLFHDTYERLAPSFGYETRLETRDFNPESSNGRLMLAVLAEVLPKIVERYTSGQRCYQCQRRIERIRFEAERMVNDCDDEGASCGDFILRILRGEE